MVTMLFLHSYSTVCNCCHPGTGSVILAGSAVTRSSIAQGKDAKLPPPSLIMYKLRRRQGRESKAHTSSRLSPPSLAASSDGLTEVLICCHYSCQHYSRKTCGFPLSTIHPAPHPLSRPCWQDHLVNIKGKKLTKKTHATTTSGDW